MDNPILKHHKESLQTNPVENEDGSTSTVRTIIMGDGDYEYLIPTVWDGKILSDEEAFKRAMESGVNWPQAPKGEKGVKVLEELDKKLHEQISTEYNKGGMVADLDKQMSFFSEGGMNAPEVDPVSGNEVPAGAMEEEVRDDVPAMLSEGEYVVPADVLRYFGVKFFEDLRTEAKSSLEGMESDGRMGGEPSKEPQGEGDISPEELAMLEEIMSQEAGAPQQMNQGGMVVGLGNPEFQPKRKFAEGGSVPPGGVSSFNPGQWNVGSSYTGTGTNVNFTGSSGAGLSWRTYKGPNGETLTIQHGPNGPLTPVPPGFVMVKDAVNEQAEKTAEQEQEMPDFGGLADQDPGFDPSNDASSWAENVSEQMSSDPMAVANDALSGANLGLAGDVLGALGGGTIGGLVGAAAGLNGIAKARGVAEYMEQQGIDTTEINANIAKSVEDLGIFGKIGEKMGWADGKKYGESLMAAANREGGAFASLSPEQQASMTSTFNDVQAALGKGSTSSSTPSSAPASDTPSSDSGPSSGASSSANEDGAGNMAKGGLVKDTRNKASKTSKAPTPKKGRAKGVVKKRGPKSAK